MTPVKKGSYYYVEISNIAAKNLDKSFHLEVSSKTNGVVLSLDYSAMSYVCKVLNSDNATETLKDLLKALYLYNQAANEYFG